MSDLFIWIYSGGGGVKFMKHMGGGRKIQNFGKLWSILYLIKMYYDFGEEVRGIQKVVRGSEARNTDLLRGGHNNDCNFSNLYSWSPLEINTLFYYTTEKVNRSW
jgi:hypothetical protein